MARINEEELRKLLKVYFIAGSTNCLKNPAEVLKEAIAGGITLFQYREKGQSSLEGAGKLELGRKLHKICREQGIPFIVNDDIELALALDADGVHIGQEDEAAIQVRQKIGDKILGVSVHNHMEAEEALSAGADYFGVGPIFPTQTKKDTRAVQGITLIHDLRQRGFTVPIVGIGGIAADNATMVMEAGADGVSVISAISLAENAREAAARLRERVFR